MESKRLNRAFTLTELLVVLVIISLLMSIILPALNRAKETARAIQCKSLMKHYSLALYSYFLETNTLLPISVQDWDKGITMHPWHSLDAFRNLLDLPATGSEYRQRNIGELEEYKPAFERRYICPSASYALSHDQDGLYPMNHSYGLNAEVYDYENSVRPRMESQSGRIPCMADAMDWWFNYWQCDKYLDYGENWVGFDTYGTAAFRHRNKANVSYWDGHIEQMTAVELKTYMKEWLDIVNSRSK
ncbi:MAG: prepilin-type N-terminal cleavage/methylation domain-containing protein [Phycisphaerae bacterium]|nr:prepilin-type N-terminal cleavage/methylation domain-containing protein [Phycisphaerae bacterium]